VGELPPDAQVKLLRALGEREIVKVGGTKTIPVDVRVIAATNKVLDDEVRKGTFREDLYFRLAVLSVRLPPLRERREDIPLLCEHFFKKYGGELGKPMTAVSPEAMEALLRYPWPGNVRELENVIYEAMVLSDEALLTEAALPPRFRIVPAAPSDPILPRPPADGLREAAQSAAGNAERALIEKALRDSDGNKTLAARALGVSRKTLFNKMKALGLRG
jgi:DNA-binding NtrC family response regulator